MSFFDDIRGHAESSLNYEVCGLLCEIGNNINLFRCTNISSNPRLEFEINPSDFGKASRVGRIVGYYHSHTAEASVIGFSDKDRVIANSVRLRAILYDTQRQIFHLFSPLEAIAPLEGRKFVLGYHDCVSYVSDYYSLKFKNPVSPIPFVPRTTQSLRVGFEDTKRMLLAVGFQSIGTKQLPIEGDLLLFKVSSDKVNHLGIFFDPVTFGHQPLAGVSCRTSLESYTENLVDVLRPPKV